MRWSTLYRIIVICSRILCNSFDCELQRNSQFAISRISQSKPDLRYNHINGHTIATLALIVTRLLVGGVYGYIIIICTSHFQLMEDRHSTSSLESALESSVNESNPPQASAGASLQSIPIGHTPLGQQSQATAATPTAPTPTLAPPQHNTALQRAVSCGNLGGPLMQNYITSYFLLLFIESGTSPRLGG